MSPSALEDEGPQGRKRSRGGEERERSRRDEKERPERRKREGERDSRRSKRRGERDDRDEREGDRDGSSWPRRRRFRDSIDASHPPDGGGKKDFISKTEEEKEKGEKKKVDDGSPPRSKSFSQHNDRGSAGHGGRDVIHRVGEHGRRWIDSKEQSGDRFREKRPSTTRDTPPRKDENIDAKMGEDGAWKHDGFFELEAGAPPPQRKRPAFREKKPTPESADLPTRHEKSGTGQDIREDGGGQHPRGRERFERSFAGGGNRDIARRAEGQPPRYGHQFRDRYNYGAASGARGRERFGGRRYDGRGFQHPGGLQIEKWKHDLFEEANRSPSPKNEEDKLAKLESLLAS